MSVIEFRASLQGNYKMLTVTLRFRNKLGRPLILGYVPGSGGATDDRGNRYVVRDRGYPGHRLHQRPQQRRRQVPDRAGGDGRRAVHPDSGGQQLFGSTFDLDVTVRRLTPRGTGRPRSGRVPAPDRRPRRRGGSASAGGPGAGATGPAPAAPHRRRPHPPDRRQASATSAPAQASPPSPFGGAHPHRRPRRRGRHCASGGGAATTPGNFTGHRGPRLRPREWEQPGGPVLGPGEEPDRPAADPGLQGRREPLRWTTQGNAYGWGRPGTHDGSAAGIGTVDGARIDPRFQVRLRGDP